MPYRFAVNFGTLSISEYKTFEILILQKKVYIFCSLNIEIKILFDRIFWIWAYRPDPDPPPCPLFPLCVRAPTTCYFQICTRGVDPGRHDVPALPGLLLRQRRSLTHEHGRHHYQQVPALTRRVAQRREGGEGNYNSSVFIKKLIYRIFVNSESSLSLI